ncbi:MAG: PAS domain-containing protein [Spirochaetales bacterium]|nr:PAS domain-containing protein [Spirochaetales bacterium]
MKEIISGPVFLLRASLILDFILVAVICCFLIIERIKCKNIEEESSHNKIFRSLIFKKIPANLIMVDSRTDLVVDFNQAALNHVGEGRGSLTGIKCENYQSGENSHQHFELTAFEDAELLNGILMIKKQLPFSEMTGNSQITKESSIAGKHFFKDLPIPIYRSTFYGELLSANDEFLSLMEIPDDQNLENIDFNQFFEESIEREYLYEMIRKDAIVKSMEIHFKRLNGKSFPALVTAYSVIENGNMIIESSLIDITAIRMLEKEKRRMDSLEYRNKYMNSINELAAGIAHDINNILAGIQGHAQVIQYKLEKDNPLLNSVGRILSAVNRADHILQGLMSSIGAYDFNPVLQNLDSFLEGVLKKNEDSLNIKGLYRIIRMDNSVGVEFDSVLMEEVIIELVKNAAAAVRGEQEIIITTALEKPHDIISSFLVDAEQKCVSFSIIDKGLGMSPDTLEKVFIPYFTTKEFGTGAGLGLTKVYGIIQKHNGAIGIVNEPGRGMTVSVYLKL